MNEKNDKYTLALKYADKMLSIAPPFSPFNTSDIIIKSNWDKDEKNESYNIELFIEQILLNLKYADRTDNFHIKLNEKGRKAKDLGGHFNYELKEKEKQDLEERKVIIDLKNAERVYKTYFTTRLITWRRFGISVLLGLLKVAETLKIWPYHK
jgi:hypothetical protein